MTLSKPQRPLPSFYIYGAKEKKNENQTKYHKLPDNPYPDNNACPVDTSDIRTAENAKPRFTARGYCGCC